MGGAWREETACKVRAAVLHSVRVTSVGPSLCPAQQRPSPRRGGSGVPALGELTRSGESREQGMEGQAAVHGGTIQAQRVGMVMGLLGPVRATSQRRQCPDWVLQEGELVS